MSPENAKVFIAEDSHEWTQLNKEAVTKAGHSVVVIVDDIQEGLAAIPRAKKLGVNVALVDGSIPGDREDGAKLTAALREAIPGIKVIDVSAFGDAIKDADAKMPKLKYSQGKLGKIVTEL